MKKALICGISGQDGTYLAKFLLHKNYQVYGTTRTLKNSSFTHLKKMGIQEKISYFSMAINDFRSVVHVLDNIRPDEIYNLAGQSSVGLSFEQPVETLESINLGTLNLLEAIRFLKLDTRYYNAGSSECFGETSPDKPVVENACFYPRSPYAAAKASAHWLIANYREAYSLQTCTGHLFNHESPIRGEQFVTKKIISSVINIYRGKQKALKMGNIDIVRDWGWAPEYVEAMWLMLQQDKMDDFVIATGKSVSLRYFIEQAFHYFDLQSQEYIECDEAILRPTELQNSYANPLKAENELHWKAQYSVNDVIKMMIEYELENLDLTTK